MAADVEAVADTPQTPEPTERGRYAMFARPDGPLIYRAVNLCERCLSCGCGDQQEPIDLTPAGVMKLIQANGGMSLLPGPLRGLFGKVMGNGRS